MALTIDQFVRSHGSRRTVVADVDFDSSYPTGGESLTATDLRLARIDFLIAEPTGTYLFRYDRTNSKLLAYTTADGNQVANTTDLSAVTNVRIFAVGR